MGISGNTYPWGFWAHQRINRQAVFTLPPELLAYYKQHIDYIEKHAVDPDKRRYVVKDEPSRHYIDLEHYGTFPYDSLPRNWNDAVEKYSEDTLKEYGICPWYIQMMAYQLTEAFKQKNHDRILKLSADIGHYIADAHVPLHNTENYNGQMTGQKGIHSFWETRLPELFGDQYNYVVGKAEYIHDLNSLLWEVVLESNNAVDSVLLFEKQINETFNSDKKYTFEEKGEQTGKTYSREYAKVYHDKLNGMVERRMQKSVKNVGNIWYTAWINSGQPNLTDMKILPLSKKKKKEEEEKKKIYEIDEGIDCRGKSKR